MKVLSVLSVVFLAGCVSATGPAYSPNLVTSQPGVSKLVIYRPETFAVPRSPMVKVNGIDSCELPANSFAVIDALKGRVNISASLWDFPGTSSLTFNADAINYVRMDFAGKSAKDALGGAFGAAGSLAVNAVSNNDGPFTIQRVYKEQAEAEMLSARQMQGCN